MGDIPAQPVAADKPGLAFYEKARRELQSAIRMSAQLQQKIALQEDRIYDKETSYLDDTPSGNIMIGFDNYTKGTGAGGALRRRGPTDQHRIFSNSSVSFKPNNDSPAVSTQSTPAHTTAPTPISTTFVKADSASNQATPTSTTSGNRTATGSKRSKKATGDDSETDTKESKKARK